MANPKILIGAVALALLGTGSSFACDPEDEQDGVETSDRSAEAEVEMVVKWPSTDIVIPNTEIVIPSDPHKVDPTIRPVRAVLLAVNSVEVHHVQLGWIDIGAHGDVDLMAPAESIPRLLGHRRLVDGRYDDIRLNFDYSAIQIGRMWRRLRVPSGEQSGFKIHTSFCLEDGVTTTIQLEWDIAELLHYNDTKGWWMEPAVTVPTPPTCATDKRTP